MLHDTDSGRVMCNFLLLVRAMLTQPHRAHTYKYIVGCKGSVLTQALFRTIFWELELDS